MIHKVKEDLRMIPWFLFEKDEGRRQEFVSCILMVGMTIFPSKCKYRLGDVSAYTLEFRENIELDT